MNRAVRVLLLWLIAMLAGAAVVWHSRFSTDVSFFLPAHPTAEQQILVDQLKEGAVSRLLMVAIEGGDSADRAALSRALRTRLAAQDAFTSVQNGDSGSEDAVRDFLLAHRYQLSPGVTSERFSVEGLQAAVGNSIDLLTSPVGMLIKPYLARDPTGELVDLLGRLNPGAQPGTQDGVWASRDGQRALLLVQTRALGSDTDGQQQAIDRVHVAFDQAAKASGLGNLQLVVSGPGLFAVKARATVHDEVSRLSTISLTAIVAVLLFVYRSPRMVLLGMVPVASGALAGIVAVSLAYGTVYGITVGFGAALIGEAVDYGIYYLVQSGQMGLANWRARFWPTIRLGVLTSVAGFGALLFSGFPGLAQLGLYSLTGVVTAALVTRFVLPSLAGENRHVDVPQRTARVLAAGLGHARLLRWPALGLALLAAGYLVQHRDHLWLPDLSALSTVSEADAELDAHLRADIGAPDARYLVVVHTADREAALQAAERAGQRLDALVDSGVIGGYDSPARFLPSVQAQAARRAALPPPEVLRERLRAALAGMPLSADKLEPFVAAVDAARHTPPLERRDLDGTGLALAVDSLLLHGAHGWNVLLPLRPPAGAADAALPLAEVRAALAGSGALFLDMKGEFDTLYGDYLGEAVTLSLAGFVFIVALLLVALRSIRRLADVLLPLVMAVVLVIAGLYASGERLQLLHLVGMLLIVAVGSNYALFFDRLAGGEHREDATLLSMTVAATTTVIGFGTLSLSSVPVLHAVGATVGPGALLALLLAAAFAPKESGTPGESGGEQGRPA